MAKNMKRIHEVRIEHLPDTEPDTSYLEQEGFEDYLRQYQQGLFYFIGIRAKANISLIQTISSGGLWGIESSSSRSYLREIEDEELNQLSHQLHQLGFSKRAISAAFKDVQHENR